MPRSETKSTRHLSKVEEARIQENSKSESVSLREVDFQWSASSVLPVISLFLLILLAYYSNENLLILLSGATLIAAIAMPTLRLRATDWGAETVPK